MAKPEIALLVRFKSSLPLDEAMSIARERADEFRALPGLVQKYYLHDPTTGDVMGFYLWDSPESLAEFRDSELRASIAAAYEAEAPPRVDVYEVMEVLRGDE